MPARARGRTFDSPVSTPAQPGRARFSPLRSVVQAFASWRTASVSLLTFSSGLPLGLVWIAIPDWMRKSGVDLRVVGLLTLMHAPWTFKIVWSPLMDRYCPPWLGRRRGWMAVCQILLCVLTLVLAGVGDRPDAPWILFAVVLAIAFASASQDIAIDAYAVEALRPEEYGAAVGARTAAYRAAMYIAGALSITAAAYISWKLVNVILALAYLPMLLVTRAAPEPEERLVAPKTLREAIWLPFLGFLARHRALEILAFVLMYKLADNLAQSLQRPFLIDMGYNDFDRGLALGTVGLFGTIIGTFCGGAVTTTLGLGHALWVFGLLQIFSNVGFIIVAQSEVHRALMYGAMGFEALTTGLGMGAFGVLLLKLTEKRFSVTQYALLSSLFGLPRLIAGPITGFTADAIGWTAFFWLTMIAGIPGLILLARFVPPGTKDPTFAIAPPVRREPLSAAALAWRGLVAGIAGLSLALTIAASLAALKTQRGHPELGFALAEPLRALLNPADAEHALELAGALVFAACIGLVTAAIFAARHGAAPPEPAS
jgi:MFS transporter, PAT family, beta-lactamase induction signal transducer AmpG